MRKVQLVETARSYMNPMPLAQKVESPATLTEAERALAQVVGGQFWGMPWMGMYPWMFGMYPWMYGMGYGYDMGYGMGYGMGGW